MGGWVGGWMGGAGGRGVGAAPTDRRLRDDDVHADGGDLLDRLLHGVLLRLGVVEQLGGVFDEHVALGLRGGQVHLVQTMA